MEFYQEVERALTKDYRKKIWRPFLSALKDYKLVNDGDRIAVTLGKPLRFENDCAHRRPYLKTAPPRTSTAAAITPRPAAPQSVEVLTVTRNCTSCDTGPPAARTVTM